MLFHEIYGSYYRTVASVLREAVRGTLTKTKMTELIMQQAFGESMLTMPEGLQREKWRLLRRDMSTPLRSEPAMPLTTLEKRWLKALLADPRIQLFRPDAAGLEDVEPLFSMDRIVWYDRYADGDDYRDPTYIAHFGTILTALREKHCLYIRCRTGKGTLLRLNVAPAALEYSEKDDRFRLIADGRKRRWTINVGRITECAIAKTDCVMPAHEPERNSVTFELEDRRNAMQRVLLHFSHLEKETKRLDERRYRVTLKYDPQDETEMVIRILAFGPAIRVTAPERFVGLLRERIRRQAELATFSPGSGGGPVISCARQTEDKSGKEGCRMIEIRGKYNTALCYCSEMDDTARRQIQQMCDLRIFADAKIRIMPDVHAGKGCTIGTTMTVGERVAPNLVGVDIGCGMETVKLKEKSLDFDRLDRIIREKIPAGTNVRTSAHPLTAQIDLTVLRCAPAIDMERAALSLGTLGGGNHFIEVDRDEDGCLYLVIHSGSRHLGVQTAGHYLRLGRKAMTQVSGESRKELISRLKAEHRESEIQQALQDLKDRFVITSDIPEQFSYVEGQNLKDYLHDMAVIQRFAALNREAMTRTILEEMGLTETERFTTIHNYIDTEHGILRKGSVSARKGEMLLIPINMRDGALICVGKGNPEWNESAPHGAGRLLSRTTAQNTLTLEQFRKEMEGIYTTCVARNTLDESPMAYKGIDAILSQISPTAEVIRQIRPVYNFKAGGE